MVTNSSRAAVATSTVKGLSAPLGTARKVVNHGYAQGDRRLRGRPAVLRTATWRKSSYSNGDGGDCLEVADGHLGLVPVRDSKCRRPGARASRVRVDAVRRVRQGGLTTARLTEHDPGPAPLVRCPHRPAAPSVPPSTARPRDRADGSP
ncbi:DUF397 domain-containing protein [Streptomyces sp. NPDC001750]|uniref:DUF397 domain-containing protein n=1 Tax=Streptomyces sp. NPDC001750 TaxID=3364607 RepID=UPI0036B3AA09